MRLTSGLACGAESTKQCSSQPLLKSRRILLPHGGPVLCSTRRKCICLAQGDCQVNAPPSSASPTLFGLQSEERFLPDDSSIISETSDLEQLVDHSARTLSWDDWVQHFTEMDSLSNNQEELKIRMQEAVRCEKYGEAAQLKQELLKVEGKDMIAMIQASLEDALKEERYGDAARIRDKGLASMQGWWSGCAEDDPVGHLLHVKEEYGRWTGRVYRARDLEDIYLRRGTPLRPATSTAPSLSAKTIGSPVMEVFLKPAPGKDVSSGVSDLTHQAVSLRVPTMDEIQARKLASSLKESNYETDSEERPTGSQPLAPSASVVRLSVSVGLDGTTSIKAQLPQPNSSPPFSHPSPSTTGSTTKSENILKKMVTKALGISPDSVEIQMVQETTSDEGLDQENSASQGEIMELEDEVLAKQLKAWRRDGAGGDAANIGSLPVSDEVIDITAAMSSLDWEDGAGPDVPPYARPNPGVLRSQVSELADELARDGTFSDLTRVPAKLEMMGRDCFVFQVLEESAYRKASSSAYKSEPLGSSAGMNSLSQVPSPSSPFDVKFNLPRSDSSNSGCSDSEGDVGSTESSFDVEIPVSRLLKQRSASSASSLSAAFDQLAEHVAQLQEAKVGRSVPRQALSDAMREITTRLVSGKQVSNVTMMHIGLPDAPEVQQVPLAAPKTAKPAAKEEASKFMYTRVPMTHNSTDPFDGLYLGAFGPHGAEMLRLSRTTLDDEEAVSAVKITGDANVPINQVSFRAKIGRKYRLDTKDVYPDQLGVVARYKGEGRVAQRGFRNSRWVEGELLVFSSSGTLLTGNAELGFVWAVPGEKRFLILLNKVDLKDCEK